MKLKYNVVKKNFKKDLHQGDCPEIPSHQNSVGSRSNAMPDLEKDSLQAMPSILGDSENFSS